MSQLSTLNDLYKEELKDLYNAETQLTKALPKMAKAATSPELQRAFQQHLQQTEQQITRLETIFERMGDTPKGKICRAMQGLIEEGEELIQEKPTPEVLDAGLISMAQRVEHYEIAGYGCVRTYAEELGEREAASLLEQTLNEEKATDVKLTQLAEGRLNRKAMAMAGSR